MSHIDTLKVYEDYKATGLSDTVAKEYTKVLENSLMSKLNEFKGEFASNKMVSMLGALILIALTAISGELWYLSKEVSILSRDMQEVRQHIFSKS
jgi:hypothetical protein